MSLPNQPQQKLEDGLKELHVKLGEQLQSGVSGSDTEKVLLDVGEAYAQLVEKYVSVPQFNALGETVRARIVNVYSSLAQILGRNTRESVMADTKSMLVALDNLIIHKPGQGRTGDITLSEHIERNIVPILDKDMSKFAFLQSMYSFPRMESFHGLIKTWRRRGKDLGKIVLKLGNES